MSFYVNRENQIKLWNIISTIPLYVNAFGNSGNDHNYYTDTILKRELDYKNRQNKEHGERWFQNIIKNFYEANLNLTPDYLQQLNKTTIAYMINDLKKIVGEKQNNIVYIPEPPKMEFKERRENHHQENTDFDNTRQTEYENMFKKPIPKDIDFRDKIDDVPVPEGNFSELLQNHIKMREEELRNLMPPPQVANKDGSTNGITTNKIKILETINDGKKGSNGELIENIIEITADFPPVSSKEMVVYSTPSSSSIVSNDVSFVSNEIEKLRQIIVSLEKQVEMQQAELELYKKQQNTLQINISNP
jgi:hypothetical protein